MEHFWHLALILGPIFLYVTYNVIKKGRIYKATALQIVATLTLLFFLTLATGPLHMHLAHSANAFSKDQHTCCLIQTSLTQPLFVTIQPTIIETSLPLPNLNYPNGNHTVTPQNKSPPYLN